MIKPEDKRVIFQIGRKDYDRIVEIAREEGVSFATIMRMLIKAHIRRYARQNPRN